jgi:hypothetical protein
LKVASLESVAETVRPGCSPDDVRAPWVDCARM